MKIGGREVVFNERFIIPQGEKVEFELMVRGTVVPIEISIEINSMPNANPVSWKFYNGKLHMVFSNFHDGIVPHVLKKPFKLGNVEGLNFGFLFSLQRVTESHLLDLIVMTGENFDE